MAVHCIERERSGRSPIRAVVEKLFAWSVALVVVGAIVVESGYSPRNLRGMALDVVSSCASRAARLPVISLVVSIFR